MTHPLSSSPKPKLRGRYKKVTPTLFVRVCNLISAGYPLSLCAERLHFHPHQFRSFCNRNPLINLDTLQIVQASADTPLDPKASNSLSSPKSSTTSSSTSTGSFTAASASAPTGSSSSSSSVFSTNILSAKEIYKGAKSNYYESTMDDLIKLADIADNENLKVVELQIKTRQWIASRVLREVYGDNVSVSANVKADTSSQLNIIVSALSHQNNKTGDLMIDVSDQNSTVNLSHQSSPLSLPDSKATISIDGGSQHLLTEKKHA